MLNTYIMLYIYIYILEFVTHELNLMYKVIKKNDCLNKHQKQKQNLKNNNKTNKTNNTQQQHVCLIKNKQNKCSN